MPRLTADIYLKRKFKAPQITSKYVPLINDLVFSVCTVNFRPRLGDKSTEKMRILYVRYPAEKAILDKNVIK